MASAASQFKEVKEHQANDYDIDFGIYSKPGAPDYNARVESCRKSFLFKEFT